jgi:hypothetical protein
VSALNLATRILASVLSAAAIAAIFVPASTAPASAQTYYSVYGGVRQTPPMPYRDERYSGSPFSDFFGALFGPRRYRDAPTDAEKELQKQKDKNAFGNLCVRTCDGRFFPVNRGGRGDVSLEKVCNAMCPSAQTKMFSGAGIDNAVAADGQKYSAMPNAFRYRTEIVSGCTCNGRDTFGVVTIDIEKDPTLRAGDYYVRNTGITLFRGNSAPHKNSDFVSIRNAPNMSPALRKQLMAIKVLPPNPHAPPAMTVTVRQTPDSSDFLQKTSTTSPPPNANAPAATQPPARTN